MRTAAISWDLQRVYPLEGKKDLGIMGRAFDLLPGGSMFSAPCIHRGIVGVTVRIISGTKAKVVNFNPVIITRCETNPDDLIPWEDDLLELFHNLPV